MLLLRDQIRQTPGYSKVEGNVAHSGYDRVDEPSDAVSELSQYARRFATEQYGELPSVWDSEKSLAQSSVAEKDWNIDPSEIEIGKKLGAGNFATVFVGRYQNCSVAVKQLTDQSDLEAFQGIVFVCFLSLKLSHMAIASNLTSSPSHS